MEVLNWLAGRLSDDEIASLTAASAHGAERRLQKQRHIRMRQTSSGKVNLIKILNRDGWVCQICGVRTPPELRGTREPSAPEVDHIIPLARGGLHIADNMQCACHACNKAKAARVPIAANDNHKVGSTQAA